MNFTFEGLADLHALVSLGILLHTMTENKSIYGVSQCYFILQVISLVPKILVLSLFARNWGQYNFIRDCVFLFAALLGCYLSLVAYPDTAFTSRDERVLLRNFVVGIILCSALISFYISSDTQKLKNFSDLIYAFALVPQFLMLDSKNKIVNIKKSFVMFLGASRAWNMIGWCSLAYYEYHTFGIATWIQIQIDFLETICFYLLFERDENFRAQLRKEARGKTEFPHILLDSNENLEVLPSTVADIG